MSQGYRNNTEAMRDNNGVCPSEYHNVDDDDTRANPDDASGPATTIASDRFVAFGEQGPSRCGNADATQPGVLERQCFHRSRGTYHESGRGARGGSSGETDVWIEDDRGDEQGGEEESVCSLETQEDPLVNDESPNKWGILYQFFNLICITSYTILLIMSD